MADSCFYLRNENLNIAIDIERGASIVALYSTAGDGPIALMPDTRVGSNETDLECSSFFMAPYSNRIRDGRFSFGGKDYQLTRGAEHAIHGDVRCRPFLMLSKTPDSVKLRFDSSSFNDVDWPWPFLLDVVYGIDLNAVTIELAMTNSGQSDMPAGFGIHPFFLIDPFGTGHDHAQLSFDVSGEYPTDAEHIPIGLPVRRPELQLFRKGSPPARGNHYYGGWNGTGTIIWPASGISVGIECDGPFRHLIVWSPGAPYFAFEPVTNATDGVNQRRAGLTDHGIVSLPPGGRLNGRIVMNILR